MATTKDRSYGTPSILEKVGLGASLLLHLPLTLGWTLLASPFHLNNKHKAWTRVLGDKYFYFLTGHFNIKQLQWALGDTREVYNNWMKGQKLPQVVDELGENSRLLWIGKRRTDRVVLYLHGGAYVLPMQYFVPDFWKYALHDLKNKDKEAGFAILQYSLVPTAPHPAPVTQAVLAVQHLISSGVQPQNIQIVSDSAGGGLALQLLSHILHPLPSVPRLTLSAPLGGAFLMSPWVSLTGQTGSMLSNDDNDVIGVGCLTYWGCIVLDDVPEASRPYLEALRAPEGWFKDLDTAVQRVLITAGDAECLRDEIVVVAKEICRHHEGARYVVQQYGVHNDPYFDFLTMEKKKSELTPVILEWLAAGF
ncbi:hypothetical protein D9615_006790 [Tricholomella constricta]|uniref:Alpha/beta hydrolase fold-3 domain-containing protein n=1 Tax=Tricholomella constricta TaxID=117010 RepID=A0A8H5H736_9AGAR|nr:hypothetical protein D9615_006790 [Tricholomella constricta]